MQRNGSVRRHCRLDLRRNLIRGHKTEKLCLLFFSQNKMAEQQVESMNFDSQTSWFEAEDQERTCESCSRRTPLICASRTWFWRNRLQHKTLVNSCKPSAGTRISLDCQRWFLAADPINSVAAVVALAVFASAVFYNTITTTVSSVSAVSSSKLYLVWINLRNKDTIWKKKRNKYLVGTWVTASRKIRCSDILAEFRQNAGRIRCPNLTGQILAEYGQD